MKKYKIVSLFSGIGGFEVGIENSNLDAEIVFASEIDKYAKISYAANFCEDNLYGDITQVNEFSIPDHDILVGGFPCQAFSIAGMRNGFEDSRGILFFDVIRILKEKQPKYILLENVKNLVSHDNGKTIEVILNTLSSLNYTIDFTVINSLDSGVPQSRERTYIIGIKDYPQEKFYTDNINNRIYKLKNNMNISNFRSFNFFNSLIYNTKRKYLKNIVDEFVDKKYHIANDNVLEFLSTNNIQDNNDCASKIIKLFDLPKNVWNDLDRQRRVYSINGISPTILARSDATKVFVNGIVRKLTPIENMRAQGFDEQFIINLVNTGISDTQMYKQSGNAVSPPVITGIINHLIRFMES